MVKDKDMQFFMINMKMKRKRNKKNWPSPTGIWTPDFWTNSRPKFEFLWRLDPSSSGFLELLDFICICHWFFTGLYFITMHCELYFDISVFVAKHQKSEIKFYRTILFQNTAFWTVFYICTPWLNGRHKTRCAPNEFVKPQL